MKNLWKIRGRGRPKGSKNKNKTEVILTSELLRIKQMINELFKLVVWHSLRAIVVEKNSC